MPKVKSNTTTEKLINDETINSLVLMDEDLVSEIIKNLSFEDKSMLWRFLYEKNVIKSSKLNFHKRINQINNHNFLPDIFIEYARSLKPIWTNRTSS